MADGHVEGDINQQGLEQGNDAPLPPSYAWWMAHFRAIDERGTWAPVEYGVSAEAGMIPSEAERHRPAWHRLLFPVWPEEGAELQGDVGEGIGGEAGDGQPAGPLPEAADAPAGPPPVAGPASDGPDPLPGTGLVHAPNGVPAGQQGDAPAAMFVWPGKNRHKTQPHDHVCRCNCMEDSLTTDGSKANHSEFEGVGRRVANLVGLALMSASPM
jgi:hypothetical protein